MSRRPHTLAMCDQVLHALGDRHLADTHQLVIAVCGNISQYHRVYRCLRVLNEDGLVDWSPADGTTGALWTLSTLGRGKRDRSRRTAKFLETCWLLPAATRGGRPG